MSTLSLSQTYDKQCNDIKNLDNVKKVFEKLNNLANNSVDETGARATFNANVFLRESTNTNTNTNINSQQRKIAVFKDTKEDIKKVVDELRITYRDLMLTVRTGEDDSFDNFVKAMAYYYYIKLMIIMFISVQSKQLTLSQGACTKGTAESARLTKQVRELTEELQKSDNQVIQLQAENADLNAKVVSLEQLVQQKDEEIAAQKLQIDEQLRAKGNSNATSQKLEKEQAELRQKLEWCDAGINIRQSALESAVNSLYGLAEQSKSILNSLTGQVNANSSNVSRINENVNKKKFANTKPGGINANSERYYDQPAEFKKNAQVYFEYASARLRLIQEQIEQLQSGKQSTAVEKDALLEKLANLERKNQELVAFMQESLPIMSDLTLSDANASM